MPVSIAAIASRDMSSATTTGRSCVFDAATSFPFCWAAWIRSQASTASSPFMPSTDRSRANASAVIWRGLT